MERFVIAYPGNLKRAWDLVGTRCFRALLCLSESLKVGNETEWVAKDLAKAMGVSERTAYRYLTRLKEKGLIAKAGRLWMMNGRLFYRGRLSERHDNIRYFEETLFNAPAGQDSPESDDLEAEGEDGLEVGAPAGRGG